MSATPLMPKLHSKQDFARKTLLYLAALSICHVPCKSIAVDAHFPYVPVKTMFYNSLVSFVFVFKPMTSPSLTQLVKTKTTPVTACRLLFLNFSFLDLWKNGIYE